MGTFCAKLKVVVYRSNAERRLGTKHATQCSPKIIRW